MASRDYRLTIGGEGVTTSLSSSIMEDLQFQKGHGVGATRPEIPPEPYYSIFERQQKKQLGREELIYDGNLDKRIRELEKNIRGLQNEIEALKRQRSVIPSKITSLPSKKYELKEPIEAIIKIDEDEVIAMIPDLEIYGEGCNEIEALNDLKLEIIDLLDDLDSYPDDNLGSVPNAWNKTLKSLINRCQ